MNHKESPAKRHQIGHCSQRDAAFQPPQWESFGTSEELELSKAEGALEAQWSNQLEMKYVCVYIYIYVIIHFVYVLKCLYGVSPP